MAFALYGLYSQAFVGIIYTAINFLDILYNGHFY
jgi:hypothetical protein